MAIFRCFRLFSECYQIAGKVGVIACAKYLFGVMKLNQSPSESSFFPVGAAYD